MIGRGISKYDLKAMNRSQILRSVWEYGPISRADIAEKLGITRAAVTVITNEMIEEKLLRELSRESSENDYEICKGRRKVLLEIDSSGYFTIGIYIDRSSISIGLTTIKNDILEKENICIDKDISLEDIISVIDETAKVMLTNSCLTSQQLVGIGMGIMPDMPVCIKKKLEENPLFFEDLQEILRERTDIPVFIDNALSQFAVVCCSQRESADKLYQCAFIYSDRENYHLSLIRKKPQFDEKFITTGNVNNMFVSPGKLLSEGYPNGCVKSELTPEAVAQKVSGIYSERETPELYRITGGDGSSVTIAQIMTAVKDGDEILRELKNELLDELSIFLNNILCIGEFDNIYFCKFGFSEEQTEEIRKHTKERLGYELKSEMNVWDISPDQRFLCGSVYATLKGLFSVNEKTFSAR